MRLDRQQRGDRLGSRVDLATEATAGGATDELQFVEWPVEVRCDDAHREVHRLRGRVDDEATAGLGHDLADLRLHRNVLDGGGAVDALHDHVSLLEGLVDVALADLTPIHLAFKMGIPVAPVVDLRGIAVERLADVEQRRQLLVGHLDGLGRSDCKRLVVCGDSRDGLALVAHVCLSKQWLIAWDAEPFNVAMDVLMHVLVGDDGMDALHCLGSRRIDRDDFGVVVWRTECLGPERAGDAHVVDVARACRDMLVGVVAWKSSANGLHWFTPLSVVRSPAAVVVRSNESPRAAAEMASRILTYPVQRQTWPPSALAISV